MNIEQYSPQSGRFLKEDGTYINIADALGGTETGQIADIEKHAAHSGRFIKEDGTVINIAESIGSGGGGGGGSSDDSATPIIEEYNGQTIQCFMSADRPIKGLNLYATCEQTTTTGAQLFDGVFTVDTVLGTNGETIQYSGRSTTDFIKVKQSTDYTGFTRYLRACYYDAGKVIISYDDDTVTRQTPEGCEYVRFCFINGSNVMFNEGSTALPYEPYTGRQPSPSPEYPQEIQTISDFAVEVKSSMEADATPQTLNITIPEQGFYGIPVSSGGNYTDASGKQWICDEFDFTNKKFIKRVGRVSLDGAADEQWVKNLTTEKSSQFYATLLNGRKNTTQCWCNRAIYDTSGTEPGKCFTSGSFFFVCVEISINTVELLREYLSTHRLDVIYPLETPVEYNLTDAEIEQYKKLRSYYKTTYIDNDAVPVCNMQAELVLDTKLYIDNKFTTLAGQILEMGV